MSSYYEILGVAKNASPDEIKQKWKKLVPKYHPDKLPEEKKEWGEAKIKEINEAYGVLREKEKREIYDRYGKEGLENQSGFGTGDMSDLMEEMLRQHGMHMGGKHRRKQVPPIRFIESLTLEELYVGKVIRKTITRRTLCEECDHTGFEDMKNHECVECKGYGVVMKLIKIGRGMMQQVQTECEKCKGFGRDEGYKKCETCDGERMIKEEVELKFKVRAGMMEGGVVRINNEGNEMLTRRQRHQTITRGVVEMIIKEKEHKIFNRGYDPTGRKNPMNIMTSIKISLAEALCGFSRLIKHLNGEMWQINEYDIVKDGSIKIVIEGGMPKENNNMKGDLFIQYMIKYPDYLKEPIREKLWELLTETERTTIKEDERYKQVETMELRKKQMHEEDGRLGEEREEQVECATQ